MLEKLRLAVWEANMLLPKYKLVTFTWGNVSGIDRESGLFVIKPSGVEYDELSPSDLPVCDLDGNVVDGCLRPSSDTPTHAVLYRAFPKIGGITHTHSPWATVYAQAGRQIKPYGTTHADYFGGAVPCTRRMTPTEIAGDYEKNTGEVIVETMNDTGTDKRDPFAGIGYERMHAVLVNCHAPFTWGDDAYKSVEAAVVLEQVAMMAFHTEQLASSPLNGATRMGEDLLKKHFDRKHGANAYYGQTVKNK